MTSLRGTTHCSMKPSPPNQPNNPLHQPSPATMRKESRTTLHAFKTDASTSDRLRTLAANQGKAVSTVLNDIVRASLNQSAPNR